MKKKLFLGSAALFIVLFVSVAVYSHCHDTEPCEVISRVIGSEKWKRSDNTVRYYINAVYPDGMPPITADVQNAR